MIDHVKKKNTSLRIETVQKSLYFTHRTAIVLQVLTVTHGILTINSMIQVKIIQDPDSTSGSMERCGWWSTIPYLVGGFNHLENMKVNGKGYPIYETENKIHVWNHQPVINGPIIFEHPSIWLMIYNTFQEYQRYRFFRRKTPCAWAFVLFTLN